MHKKIRTTIAGIRPDYRLARPTVKRPDLNERGLSERRLETYGVKHLAATAGVISSLINPHCGDPLILKTARLLVIGEGEDWEGLEGEEGQTEKCNEMLENYGIGHGISGIGETQWTLSHGAAGATSIYFRPDEDENAYIVAHIVLGFGRSLWGEFTGDFNAELWEFMRPAVYHLLQDQKLPSE